MDLVKFFCFFLFRPFQVFLYWENKNPQKIQQQMDMGLSFFQSIQLNDAWIFDFTFDTILTKCMIPKHFFQFVVYNRVLKMVSERDTSVNLNLQNLYSSATKFVWIKWGKMFEKARFLNCSELYSYKVHLSQNALTNRIIIVAYAMLRNMIVLIDLYQEYHVEQLRVLIRTRARVICDFLFK